MQLTELGMDAWFHDHARICCDPGQRLARVTAVDRGQCVVRNAQGEVPAKATGNFMRGVASALDMPCVGDWVCVEYHDAEQFASIHAVLPRKSFLRRKSVGKTPNPQMIAANLDAVLIVQSCHYDFNVGRLERYLLMAGDGQVEPVLVLTKTDLVSGEVLAQLMATIRDSGITAPILAVSNVSGSGLDQVRAVMQAGKTYCLVGSSGVGKSTLINQLTGHATVKTGVVSKSGEGRHTTVRRHLIALAQGAMLIDTPGMREVGVLMACEELDDSFEVILQLAPGCRFTNCGHTNEPGCAVLEAVANGTLQQDRYHQYIKLKAESTLQESAAPDRRTGGRRS